VKRFILLPLAAFGGFVLLSAAVLLALAWMFAGSTSLPGTIVLELNLEDGLVEMRPDDPLLRAVEPSRLTVREVVEALDRAGTDPQVVALTFRGGAGLPGWATVDDLREAVERFRASGKPTVFFAESFGEFSPGQLAYHLATAFDEVYLQPSGEVGLAPLLMETFFLRDALDRIGVRPRFDSRGEYKDAQEIFTETGFTPAARDARRAVLEELEGSLVAGMGSGRTLPADSARALLARGPYPAREALAAGLVDGLLYLDQVRDRVRESTDASAEPVGIGQYLAAKGGAWTNGPRVALVYGVGAIQRGSGGFDFLSGGTALGSGAVSSALREAADDPRTRAVLFRVDSPGGSWVASDQVRREVRRIRDAGIPIVVSMGNLAASGGYVIAMDADRIVAQPTTLTGSIGVLGGKLVSEAAFDSIGIDWDQVRVSGESSFYSAVEDFSARDWERFQLSLDRIYADFVEGVAAGRGMGVDEVESIARGRVWSGRDAGALGLVDRLGGFHAALDEIRGLLGESLDAPLEVALYPAERSLVQLLLEERFSPLGAAARLQALAGSARAGLEERLTRALFGVEGAVRMAEWGVPGR
jgi:protease-4